MIVDFIKSTIMKSLAQGIPITASSILSPLGGTLAEHRERLRAGLTGLSPATPDLPILTHVGKVGVPLPPLPAPLRRYDTRATRMAAFLLQGIKAEVADAVERWGAQRVGIFLGNCNAGTAETEDALLHEMAHSALPTGYRFSEQHIFFGILHVMRILSGCTGPGAIISTACTASAKAFASAQRLIRAGVIDAAIVGGVDTLCRLTLHGFHSLGLTSSRACCPFGFKRDGLNLGEGGALMLLERAGASSVALLSVGESSDAFHVTTPAPGGVGAVLAMRKALASAELDAADIAFIQSHGTSTPANDAAEGSAIFSVFPACTPVVATKCYTGHLLGASGAAEAVLTQLSLEGGWLPNSLFGGSIDPNIPINLCARLTEFTGRYAMSNSFGFGGSNCCVVLGRLD